MFINLQDDDATLVPAAADGGFQFQLPPGAGGGGLNF